MRDWQIADAAAVKACKDMYDESNTFMRSVAAIIAMEAISVYRQEMARIKRSKRNRPGDEK